MNTLNAHQIVLRICPEHLAVCKLSPNSPLPSWLEFESDSFVSITKTKDELSIVCRESLVPSDVNAQRHWRMFKIKGQLDFNLVGILTQVITPLAEHSISIYTLSTYDTDYVLVKEKDFGRAIEVLKRDFAVET